MGGLPIITSHSKHRVVSNLNVVVTHWNTSPYSYSLVWYVDIVWLSLSHLPLFAGYIYYTSPLSTYLYTLRTTHDTPGHSSNSKILQALAVRKLTPNRLIFYQRLRVNEFTMCVNPAQHMFHPTALARNIIQWHIHTSIHIRIVRIIIYVYCSSTVRTMYYICTILTLVRGMKSGSAGSLVAVSASTIPYENTSACSQYSLPLRHSGAIQ